MRNVASYVLNLVSVEVWHAVYDRPWDRAPKIDSLVHNKRHDASCEDIILKIGVPGCPQAFKNVKVDIVPGYFIELAPVSLWGRGKERRCRVPIEKTVR